MAGVCAHAAEFSVDTTSLPMGEAYKAVLSTNNNERRKQ